MLEILIYFCQMINEYKEYINIVASLITVIAFFYGLYQYKKSSKDNVEIMNIQKKTLETQERSLRRFENFIKLQIQQQHAESLRFKLIIKPELKITRGGSRLEGNSGVLRINITSVKNYSKNIKVLIFSPKIEFFQNESKRSSNCEFKDLREGGIKYFELITKNDFSINNHAEQISFKKEIIEFIINYEDIASNKYSLQYRGSEFDGYVLINEN